MPFSRAYRITCLRQLGGIGDLLMLTPVFRGLKEKYLGCQLTVATTWDYQSGSLPQLLRHNPHIDQVVRIEPMEFATGFLKRARWEFRNVPNDHIPDCVQNADLVIELSVICAMTETEQMQTPEGVRSHRTDIWCAAAGVNPSSRFPVLRLTAEELEWGRQWCDDNLGTGIRIGIPLKTLSGTIIGKDMRGWPYTELFINDLQRAGYKVVTLDSMHRINENTVALVGKPIRYVAAVIAHLDALVTPDTGLLHVAGAVGTPILGLFGSTDGDLRMREYAGSYTLSKRLISCGNCFYSYPCLKSNKTNEHAACMKRIGRDLVMHELECLLERYGKQLPQPRAC